MTYLHVLGVLLVVLFILFVLYGLGIGTDCDCGAAGQIQFGVIVDHASGCKSRRRK